MNNKKSNLYLKIFLVGFFLTALFLAIEKSEASMNYRLLEAIPMVGNSGDSVRLPTLITGIYKLGIWVVGICALFMLSVGGFYYMTSAGNASIATTAKKIITDSLIGLVVAMTAWLLLYTINPDLVQNNVANPSLFRASMNPTQEGGTPEAKTPIATKWDAVKDMGIVTSGSNNSTGLNSGDYGNTDYEQPGNPPTDSSSKSCKPGIACQPCPSCIDVSPCKESPCKAIPQLADPINSAISIANSEGIGIRVTEGWPPTVDHISSCHQDGTCVDMNFTNEADKGVPEKVKRVYDILVAEGLSPVYESNNCTPYTNIGVNCKYYSTMTAPSFHVNM